MPTSAAGSDIAPTLAAGAAALPPGGARSPWGGPAANKAPTLAAGAAALALQAAALPEAAPLRAVPAWAARLGAAALSPSGARSAWGGPAPNKPPTLAAKGFTLLELLVVVAIIAIATAGVSFALRDSQATQLEREAQRLAALLESARAQSRSSGVPVRWYPTPGGFRFEGVPPEALPDRWLEETTQASGSPVLVLGPEPIIGKQEVVLMSPALPGRSLRIATDGLRPFAVAPGAAP